MQYKLIIDSFQAIFFSFSVKSKIFSLHQLCLVQTKKQNENQTNTNYIFKLKEFTKLYAQTCLIPIKFKNLIDLRTVF